MCIRILQARFSIIRGLTRFWDEATLNDIMKAYIILHNMIIEDKRDPNGVQQDNDYNKCLKASLQPCHESIQMKFKISFNPVFALEIEKLILNSMMI